MPKVNYVTAGGQRFEVIVDEGENVMRGALYNGVEGIVGECGGGLSCATCHVYVDDSWIDRVGTAEPGAERELLESAAAEVRECSRLSCQIVMTADLDGLVVQLPDKQF